MKKNFLAVLLLASVSSFHSRAEVYTATSPDGRIVLSVDNGKELTYSVRMDGEEMIAPSPMGFEFVGEKPMKGDFAVMAKPKAEQKVEAWDPVVRAKHAHVSIPYTALTLNLKEKEGDLRRMDIEFRVMNEGVAFRYTLYGGKKYDYRRVMKELTGFAVPAQSYAWMSDFAGAYNSSQESEFVKTPVTEQTDSLVKGLPYLIESSRVQEFKSSKRSKGSRYMALLQADLDNWPGFFVGRGYTADNSRVMLTTKLAPFGDNDEKEIKVLFSDRTNSPWRIILMGDNPGKFIESEVVRSLNPDNVIADAKDWVKPGMSAWDNWWSMEDAVTLPVAKKYVDLASSEGWPYMLVDWKWYGKFDSAEANPLKCADYMNVPELIEYAKNKNVGIWVWIHSGDISQQDNWRDAFPLYEKWGVKGIKIDFMDHENQYASTWYRKIIKEAAKHHLMVDFHGAYCPDGIDRTYPNMITREGVMGEEYAKFSDHITPEHNINLCFTRLLAGQMDYTPGGFLNVTLKEHHDKYAAGKNRPTVVANTRCQELAKFVMYESPVTIFCEHPDNCMGQPGMDFLREVKTTWDDIHFIDGYPGEHIELAKKADDGRWFVAGMNNSTKRTVNVDLSFLPAGTHDATIWMDAKNADKKPTELVKKTIKVSNEKPLKVDMNVGGGFVMIVEGLKK